MISGKNQLSRCPFWLEGYIYLEFHLVVGFQLGNSSTAAEHTHENVGEM